MNRTGATLPDPNASAGIDRVGERAPRERRRERRFEFGRELEADGRWVRQESAFRRWVTADGSSGLPAVAGRYHLYVSICDPWSHRSVIVRRLLGLENAIGISYLDPYRDHRGWAFTGGDAWKQDTCKGKSSSQFASDDHGRAVGGSQIDCRENEGIEWSASSNFSSICSKNSSGDCRAALAPARGRDSR